MAACRLHPQAPPSIDRIEAVAELLGIAPDGLTIERLARALNVAAEDVEQTLRKRGEDDIADAVAVQQVRA